MGGGGWGDRPHLMSSVCIDVRPARLVESAAAPSGPIPFSLRERGGEGQKGQRKRGARMHLSSSCCHPRDLITTAERAREIKGPRRGGGRFPPPPPLRSHTAVSQHSGQPTPRRGSERVDNGKEETVLVHCSEESAGNSSARRKRSFRSEAGEARCRREAATGSRWKSGRASRAAGRAGRRERKMEEAAEREQGESGGSGEGEEAKGSAGDSEEEIEGDGGR